MRCFSCLMWDCLWDKGNEGQKRINRGTQRGQSHRGIGMGGIGLVGCRAAPGAWVGERQEDVFSSPITTHILPSGFRNGEAKVGGGDAWRLASEISRLYSTMRRWSAFECTQFENRTWTVHKGAVHKYPFPCRPRLRFALQNSKVSFSASCEPLFIVKPHTTRSNTVKTGHLCFRDLGWSIHAMSNPCRKIHSYKYTRMNIHGSWIDIHLNIFNRWIIWMDIEWTSTRGSSCHFLGGENKTRVVRVWKFFWDSPSHMIQKVSARTFDWCGWSWVYHEKLPKYVPPFYFRTLNM